MAVAVLLVAVGAMLAVVGGRPDAALLVSPWAILLLIGLSATGPQEAEGRVSANADRVVVGDQVEITAVVRGTGGWVQTRVLPEPGFWGESGPTDGEVSAAAAVLHTGRPTELSHTLTASTWGHHDVGRVDLTIHERHGLIRWSGTLYDPNRVRVHPRHDQIQELLTPWRVRRLAGAHPSRAVGRGVEYVDIRPFDVGDSLRDINWQVSARSNELWVSRRAPEQSTDVVLLLDSFTETGHDVRTVLGLAIESALALADGHVGASDRVGVIELGGIVRWVTPGSGRHHLHLLTDALLATRLYDNAADPELAMVPPRALPPHSFVVALSPLLDRRFVEGLRLFRAVGHDVAVVECPPTIGDDLERWPTGHASRLALRLWQAEREVTRDDLAREGIIVGRWYEGEPVERVLADVAFRRRRARAVAHR
jgi:uncharacterized protein (DUF58 family)